ncbi:MAG: ATP-binding cassette domain-containing protein [Actinomycetota bacterium]|jgi:iron complex transport system ATP-binding protein|nr:ATP-binding cassette domain-containing protein [Actinomycetota bacterium]
MPANTTPALRFQAVDLDRPAVPVLRGVDFVVGGAERWVVLGPNGSGKTTLLEVASGYLHPTRGQVEVLGERLGRTDVRSLRERVGLVSASVAKMLEPRLTGTEVVMSAAHGALEPWWHRYDATDRRRARDLLEAAGFGHTAQRPWGVLSEGERQQVLLARSLVKEPELLLLDEPAAGLDLGGRERLVARLGELAADAGAPPTVLVTHHVEEIPAGFDHALLLREGRVVAAGPAAEAMTAETLSATFGLRLALDSVAGRWSCRAV